MTSINDFIEYLLTSRPRSVLDINMSTGLIGTISRQVLDFAEGRIKEDSWNTIVSGIAVDNTLENYCWKLYTNIEFGKGFDLNRLGGFDLVVVDSDYYSQDDLNTLKLINKMVIIIE